MINKDILKNIQLVVFDLDGTLLNSSGEIGESTKHLVKELRSLGVRFSFASGRLHSAIIKYAQELELQTPLISLDGSLIKSVTNNQIISESYIKEKYVKRAIKLADHFLVKIALCLDEAIYYTEHNSLIPNLLDKFGADYKEVEEYSSYHKSKTLEIVFAGDYKNSLKTIESKMMFPYTWGLYTNFFKSYSQKGIYYLEIRKHGVNKGTGLKRLLKHLNLGMRNTVVMGDWYNDRELFKTNAVKIAVANAVPEIKNNADYITQKTNDEDGTAEFLEMLYKVKKKNNS
ncbi:MAG: HAD family hydrolase [Melioribacteraceae bacterium]|jgi:Cof subfamily protein (haloacid dehalogenase superfamily)|nr:hypothetical protein [Ignavibacteriota bacterium]MBZ0181668.1 HAD family hydrolase [Melioribacteraceae bacterium]|tara:strand:+ start:34 stop:894 length:861 start_codon:yes stop_codon:yes gene_type:complete